MGKFADIIAYDDDDNANDDDHDHGNDNQHADDNNNDHILANFCVILQQMADSLEEHDHCLVGRLKLAARVVATSV